jgi:hypothetical protein
VIAHKHKFLPPPRPLPHTNIHIHHNRLSRTAAAALALAPPPPPPSSPLPPQCRTSLRKNYQPSVELKYWTADDSGEEEIEEWLRNEIEGEPCLVFYASFLNWCNQQVQKLGDPRAKYQSPEEKVKAEALRETLRKQPLDINEFTGLMARYFRGPWKGGMKTGAISDPNNASK